MSRSSPFVTESESRLRVPHRTLANGRFAVSEDRSNLPPASDPSDLAHAPTLVRKRTERGFAGLAEVLTAVRFAFIHVFDDAVAHAHAPPDGTYRSPQVGRLAIPLLDGDS